MARAKKRKMARKTAPKSAKRLGRSMAACANTRSEPVSYQALPGPYDVERPCVSLRLPPSSRQRMPGPQCLCRNAQPPGGNATLSPRSSNSPCGTVSSEAPIFSNRRKAVLTGAALLPAAATS